MTNMEHASIRCMINNTFLVIDLSSLWVQYKNINIKHFFECQNKFSIPNTEVDLGDFDLHGKMIYHSVNLLDLKLTFLDEKALRIKNQETHSFFLSLIRAAIIYTAPKPEQENEDWFGEKLFDEEYSKKNDSSNI